MGSSHVQMGFDSWDFLPPETLSPAQCGLQSFGDAVPDHGLVSGGYPTLSATWVALHDSAQNRVNCVGIKLVVTLSSSG